MIEQKLIGENIRRYRKAANMTQGELAAQVKVTTQAVSKWENGGTPDALILYDVAQALGVSIDALYGLSDEVKADHLKALGLEIAEMAEDQRMEKIIQDLLILLVYASGKDSLLGFFEHLDDADEDENFHLFNMVIENGFTVGDLLKKKKHLFICFNEENSYDSFMCAESDYQRVFKVLSGENVLKIILLMLHQPDEFAITTAAIADKLDMSESEVEQIMTVLETEGFVTSHKVITQDKEIRIWNTYHQTQILSLLMILSEFLEKENFMVNMAFMPEDFRYLQK